MEIKYFIVYWRNDFFFIKKPAKLFKTDSVVKRSVIFSRDAVRSLSPVFIGRYTRLVLRFGQFHGHSI